MQNEHSDLPNKQAKDASKSQHNNNTNSGNRASIGKKNNGVSNSGNPKIQLSEAQKKLEQEAIKSVHDEIQASKRKEEEERRRKLNILSCFIY